MKYELPVGVIAKEPLPEKYTKETKLTFIDLEYGEFISYVKALQDAGASTHPKAVTQRREATMLQRYGSKNISQVPGIREQAADTMEKRYGVRAALKKREFLDKSKATLKSHFGVEHPMESAELRNRQKESVRTKYGVNNVMQVKEVQEKQISSLKEKYGVSNAGEIHEEMITRLPNGKSVFGYAKELNIAYTQSTASIIYRTHGPEVAQIWLEEYTGKYKSSLETAFSSLIPQATRIDKTISKAFAYRPDFKLKDIYIDLDGLRYHSDKYKENNYHLVKREAYNKEGLTLLQFRQDEIVFKNAIVKSVCLAKAGLSTYRLFARKLTIKEITTEEANLFFERTHLMGKHGSSKAIALVDEKDYIKCCMSYKRYETGIDISRFSCELETSVTGGFSRLLHYIEQKEHPDFIQSFVDLRYGDGSSLNKQGFLCAGITLGWKWTDGIYTYNRLRCQANMDERGLSERQHAEELGLFKIYDAGQAKWVKHFNK